MIFFLAMRNLIRNVKNNLVILLLLTLIILLFFLGNSVLAQTDSGLRKSYVDNYTADLVVKTISDVPFGLFGANTPAIGEYFSIPVLKNINQIQSVIDQSGLVEKSITQLSGVALMDINGGRYWASLFGVDGPEYEKFFKGIDIVEGSFFTSSSRGAIIGQSRKERLEMESGSLIRIGDPILLTMAGNNGFKIREVSLSGVYTYKNSSAVLDDLLIVDAQTLRALNSTILASFEEETPADDLFSSSSIDDLFGSSDVEAAEDDSFSVDSVLDILSLPPEKNIEELSGGSWSFFMLRLKDKISSSKAKKTLNRMFRESGLSVEVVDWRDAAGLSALMVLMLQIMYNGGFLLVLLAGVIAIVNILIISIYKRTGEIGTLRAIGATKEFIRSMIYIENVTLSFTAGLLAILSGNLLIELINKSNIVISNSILQSLFGENVLQLSFLPAIALISLVVALFLGYISTIYPVRMALSIEPVHAVAKG